ncbi:uncharacterized protein LOC129874184 [Solanum dulcamara]|uniref:uncharacterized protein LOC129874184 n=1 Tax=Solanum dulcamara TaxID=45834 RepID=UPI002484EB14|nr:uncharacterized protein LOC129874184 [Solanum dulcamara]
MASSTSISLSFLVINPKSPLFPPQNLSISQISSTRNLYQYTIHRPNLLISSTITRNRRFSSTSELSEVKLDETADQIVSSTGDEGVSTVIQSLLFIAFVGLSILTIGVIYIAVTDFLQKREKEKFEKEEAAKKKKIGRKGKIVARARGGPRGFGQKVEEAEDD